MLHIRFTSTPKLPRDLAHLDYKLGDIVHLAENAAQRWLNRGVAEIVPAPPAPPASHLLAETDPDASAPTAPAPVNPGAVPVETPAVVPEATPVVEPVVIPEPGAPTPATPAPVDPPAVVAQVDIPTAWEAMRPTVRIALARLLTGETIDTAANANTVILAELDRRAKLD